MSTIKLEDLTADQKAELAKQLAEEKQTEKEQRAVNLKALEEIAQEQLPKAIEQLKKASQALESAKLFTYTSFVDYLKLKIETIGVSPTQKTHTISLPNAKVILGYRVTDGYDDNANYGLALVHKFLGSLAKDAESAKLMKLVNRLLQKNAKGDLDSKKVLELAQHANEEYPNTDFAEGMELIQKAYKPKMSKWFIEATTVDGQGVEKVIPLNITSCDLPKDFDLSFLLPKSE